MSKRVVILQSNYIPWKGYFDLIAAADECILFDDMQYTRRDWRNRNYIKTETGTMWLTVPVQVKGKYHQTIRDTQIEGHQWQAQHYRSLQQNYARAPYAKEILPWLEALYLGQHYTHLSPMNRRFIEAITQYLGINTILTNSWDYQMEEGRTERLVSLCREAGATEYISGPAAQSYIDPALFAQAGIALRWYDYSGYPEYPQLWGNFVHAVSVLDLLFNCGKDAPSYMHFGRP